MARWTISRRTLSAWAFAILGFAALLIGGRQGHAEDQQSVLARLISSVLSSPDITVKVGSVEGALASKSVIRDITLADKDGIWLKVSEVRFEWRRTALLARRLEIDQLEIDHIDFSRRPKTSAKPAPAGEPLLPELPLKVEVKGFALKELALGAPITGVAARLSAQGRLKLGPPAEGLDANFNINRLDGEGRASVKLHFTPKGETLEVALRHNEGAGGLVASLARLQGVPPVSLAVTGSGPLDAFAAELALKAGPEIEVSGTASLKRSGPARHFALDLAGEVAAALPEAARPLFPGRTVLSARGAIADGPLRMEALRLASERAEITLAGRFDTDMIDARIDGAIADLAPLDPRIKGAVTLAGTIDGAWSNPRFDLALAVPKLQAIGRPVRDIAMRLRSRDAASPFAFAMEASGLVDGRPLAASATIARQEADDLAIRDLRIAIGSLSLSGEARQQAGGITGRISLAAPDLDHASALLLMPLRGALEGQADLMMPEGRQDIRLHLKGRGIVAGGASLGGIEADLAISDVFGRPAAAGKLTATGATAGGQRFERVDLLARNADGATDATLEARGPATTLAAALRLSHASQTLIEISRASLSKGQTKITLTKPASIAITEGMASTEAMTLAIGRGTLTLAGQMGDTLALRLKAKDVPLAELRAISPTLVLDGTLDAEAELSGTMSAPSGPYSLGLRQLAHVDLRKAGLPPLDVSAKGKFDGGSATLDATLRGGAKLALAITGSARLASDGPLDLRIKGSLDAALANAGLAGSGQRLTGQVQVDAALKGNASAPKINGAATLTGGTFSDPVQGTRLTNLSGRMLGAGDHIRIERLGAQTPGGGTLNITGSLVADPSRGFPADLRLTGSKARLVENDIVILVADLDVGLSGPITQSPLASGVVKIVSLDVLIPDRLAGASAPLANAKHIAPPEETRKRLAEAEKRKRQAAARKAGGTGGARLGLRLIAPSHIFVRGRGIDAELGGELALSGTLHAPRASGAFELRRGQIDMLTQRLAFSRGKLTFAGDLIPELDFLSSTSAGGVTAKVGVSGRADEPAFTLTSEPELPPDEVLARLMFARAAGNLSPLQAVQLAHAVARLTGKGGPDFLDRTRRALGVDTLDVNLGNRGPTVGASRYVTRNIRLGVKTGASAEETGVTVNVDVTRRIRLQGEATRDGNASVGIGAEIEY